MSFFGSTPRTQFYEKIIYEPPPPNKASLSIPSAGDVLQEVDRARTPESKVRVNSRRLDPIDSIGPDLIDNGRTKYTSRRDILSAVDR